jgi:hypothetical protein
LKIEHPKKNIKERTLLSRTFSLTPYYWYPVAATHQSGDAANTFSVLCCWDRYLKDSKRLWRDEIECEKKGAKGQERKKSGQETRDRARKMPCRFSFPSALSSLTKKAIRTLRMNNSIDDDTNLVWDKPLILLQLSLKQRKAKDLKNTSVLIGSCWDGIVMCTRNCCVYWCCLHKSRRRSNNRPAWTPQNFITFSFSFSFFFVFNFNLNFQTFLRSNNSRRALERSNFGSGWVKRKFASDGWKDESCNEWRGRYCKILPAGCYQVVAKERVVLAACGAKHSLRRNRGKKDRRQALRWPTNNNKVKESAVVSKP